MPPSPSRRWRDGPLPLLAGADKKARQGSRTLLPAGLALIPPLVLSAFLILFAVDVPQTDDWRLLEIAGTFQSQGFSVAEFFRPHNEHRMPVPIALGYAVSVLHYDTRLLSWLGLAFCALSYALILRMAVGRRLGEPAEAAWAAVTLSIVLFSFAQHENWLWGWQLQWHLHNAVAIATFALLWRFLDNGHPAFLFAAALCAVAAHYCLASGIALWPIGLLLIAVHRGVASRASLAWLAIGALSSALYFLGYPSHHPSVANALQDPLKLIRYVGFYLAGPLGADWIFGIALAAAVSGTWLWLLRRRHVTWAAAAPWIGLLLYAVASAVITGLGRSGLGVAGQAKSSRYTTVALLLLVSAVPLILSLPALGGRARLITRIAGGVLTVWALAASLLAIPSFLEQSAGNQRKRACLAAYETASDSCLTQVFPDPAFVRAYAPQLRRLGWSGFDAGAAPQP